MDPVIGSAFIAGGQGIAESAFNAFSAHRQQVFQRDMANTAHQRQVRDLKLAGLNPILSARLGGSAVPPGSAAQAAGPDIAQAVTSAKQARTQENLSGPQMALANAQVEDVNSAAALKRAQTQTEDQLRSGRIQEQIAHIYDMLQSGHLKGEQKTVAIKQAKLLQQQWENLNAEKAQIRVKSLPWQAAEGAINSAKKAVPSLWEKTKRLWRKGWGIPEKGGKK